MRSVIAKTPSEVLADLRANRKPRAEAYEAHRAARPANPADLAARDAWAVKNEELARALRVVDEAIAEQAPLAEAHERQVRNRAQEAERAAQREQANRTIDACLRRYPVLAAELADLLARLRDANCIGQIAGRHVPTLLSERGISDSVLSETVLPVLGKDRRARHWPPPRRL